MSWTIITSFLQLTDLKKSYEVILWKVFSESFLVFYIILLNFQGDGKVTFEEMVVMTVKRKQNEDEDPESRKLFDKFDSNKDGYLNREELVEVLAQLGPRLSSTDVEEILRDYDENHDGLIQFSGIITYQTN